MAETKRVTGDAYLSVFLLVVYLLVGVHPCLSPDRNVFHCSSPGFQRFTSCRHMLHVACGQRHAPQPNEVSWLTSVGGLLANYFPPWEISPDWGNIFGRFFFPIVFESNRSYQNQRKSYTRWFKVTFSSPNWRALNPLKGSLNHPKKVTLNHQVWVCCWPGKDCTVGLSWECFCGFSKAVVVCTFVEQ